MQNHFFTHKFLPIIGLFLLVAFSLCTSCFAYDSSNLPDFSNLVSDNDNYVITYSSSDGYRLIVVPSTANLYYCGQYVFNGGTYISSVNSTLLSWQQNSYFLSYECTSDIEFFSYKIVDNVWTRTSISSSSPYNSIYIGKEFDESTGFIFSTIDLKTPPNTFGYPSSLSDRLVFQIAPQVEEVPKVELMKATQVEEIPQQIVAIVTIVLPIFLAIFGVLLVLYLIKSKNLLQL